DVSIALKNRGSMEVNSFLVNWSINGVAQPVFTWNGTLAKDDSTTIVLGDYDFSYLQPYEIRSEILDPNGSPDIDPNDNALIRSNLYAALPAGDYTVGGTAPDFNSFAAIQNVLSHGGIAGNVNFLVR